MKVTHHNLVAASRRAALCSSALALALGLPAAAYAQGADEAQPAADAPAAADENVDSGNEIVVTATKREQTLQDVPVAVTVTTAQTIERAQIRDIKDLTTVVPSLRVTERQNSTNTNFLIRGFGNGANNAGIEPSVGVLCRWRLSLALGSTNWRFPRCPAHRSAARARNRPCSARMRRPASSRLSRLRPSSLSAVVSKRATAITMRSCSRAWSPARCPKPSQPAWPLVTTSATAIPQNLATGNKTSDRNRWFIRGQLLVQPDNGPQGSPDRRLWQVSDELCCGVFNVQQGSRTGVLLSPLIGGQVNAPSQLFDNVVYTNFDSTNKVENYGVSGQIDYEFGPMTLTSITAYRRGKTASNFDTDFTSGRSAARGGHRVHRHQDPSPRNCACRPISSTGSMCWSARSTSTKRWHRAPHVEWGTKARTFANVLVSALFKRHAEHPAAGRHFRHADRQSRRATPTSFFAAGQGITEDDSMKDENFSIFSQIDFKVNRPPDPDRRGELHQRQEALFGQPDLDRRVRRAGYSGAAQCGYQCGRCPDHRRNSAGARRVRQCRADCGLWRQPADWRADPGADSGWRGDCHRTRCWDCGPLQFLIPILNIPNAVEPGRTSDDKFHLHGAPCL